MSYFVISDGKTFKKFNTAQDPKELVKVIKGKILVVWGYSLQDL